MSKRVAASAIVAVCVLLGIVPAASAARKTFVVVYAKGASASSGAAAVRAAGGKVVRVNRAVGVATVRARAGFARRAERSSAILGAAPNRKIGRVPGPARSATPPRATPACAPPVPRSQGPRRARPGRAPQRLAVGHGDDGRHADGSYATQPGSHAVRVGVLDTGIQGDHPDIAPNFNAALSRNFTTDDPVVDGECADEPDGSCSDPATSTRTVTARTSPARSPRRSTASASSGVAPGVELVNLRAGQDSGYFFIQPPWTR